MMMLAAALYAGALPHVSILGGRPDLVMLIVAAWALNATLEESVVWAFSGGICKDLLSAAPIGTSVVGLVVLVFTIHTIRQQIYQVGLLTLVWVVLLGTLMQQGVVFTVVYSSGYAPALMERLGLGMALESIQAIVLPVVVLNLAAILPVYGVMRAVQRRIDVGGRMRS